MEEIEGRGRVESVLIVFGCRGGSQLCRRVHGGANHGDECVGTREHEKYREICVAGCRDVCNVGLVVFLWQQGEGQVDLFCSRFIDNFDTQIFLTDKGQGEIAGGGFDIRATCSIICSCVVPELGFDIDASSNEQHS